MSAPTIEDAQAIRDMRLKMVQNMQKGLAPEHGIELDELRSILDKIRKTRSVGAISGKAAKADAVIPLDLDAFMKKK